MQIGDSCCFSVCSIGFYIHVKPMKNCPEDFIYMMLKSAHLYCLYSSRYLVFYSLLKSSISPCITLYLFESVRAPNTPFISNCECHDTLKGLVIALEYSS